MDVRHLEYFIEVARQNEFGSKKIEIANSRWSVGCGRGLREQPNHGQTIIEKFIEYSDVGFTVVLLAADDRGGLLDQIYEEQKLRARQNVIFELGFFIGKLGRERVCALYEEGVEIPSDYQGVAFVPLDTKQAWRFELAKEMKISGLQVDLNMVL